MNYQIQLGSALTHILKIQAEFKITPEKNIELKLPFWRPGRYEAANYAKNIKKIIFKDENNHILNYTKTSHSTWQVHADSERIIAEYEYYAHQLDAGNSWYSEDQAYINFVNCLLFSEKHLSESCEVRLELPSTYQIACGLPENGNVLKASCYHQLVDSPMIASDKLMKLEYSSHGIPFSIWFHGEQDLLSKKVIDDFKRFSDYQISTMGEFPEKEYHFLNEITSYKHYHGVEHANSTVICIGPGAELHSDDLYSEFLGVSSHELFHAWNIMKIRPTEMMPYDFGSPVSFPTGYVAEGFTTYYGDIFLTRSGVFGSQWYFNELNKLFNRHFHNYGRLNNSVIDTSIDLWIDGYQPSAPHKKSSIYVEGAMIALTLDLTIRKNTNNEKSLDDVMRLLWKDFGKTAKGYSLLEIEQICELVNGGKMTRYFQDYVYGIKDKTDLVNDLLSHVGCELRLACNDSLIERKIGIKIFPMNGQFIIVSIAPQSIGESYFSVKDKIISINGKEITETLLKEVNESPLTFEIERNKDTKVIEIEASEDDYFKNHTIAKVKNPSAQQKDSFKAWLNSEF